MAKFELIMSEAQDLLNGKEFKKSLDLCLQALKISPNDGRAHLTIGVNYYELGDANKACEHFSKCGKWINHNPVTLEMYAIALTNCGQHTKSFELFESIINKYPELTTALYNYGFCLHTIGQDKKALSYFQQAEAKGYESFNLYYHEAFSYKELKKYSLAKASIQKALALEPENAKAAALHGDISSNLGEWKDAVEHYSRAYYYDPEYKRALIFREISRERDQQPEFSKMIMDAEELYNGKQFKKALDRCLAALNIYAESERANSLAGSCYYTLKDFEKCCLYYAKADNWLAEYPELSEKYALALALNNQHAKSFEVFESLIKKFPTNKVVLFEYGMCLSNVHQYEKALGYLQQAKANGLKTANLFMYEGLCYAHLDKFPVAFASVEKALAMEPNNSAAASIYGDVCFRKGEWSEAITWYSKALTYDPNNYIALNHRLDARVQIKDAEGNVINLKAAQDDADTLLRNGAHGVKVTQERGKPRQVTRITVSEKGMINYLCE